MAGTNTYVSQPPTADLSDLNRSPTDPVEQGLKYAIFFAEGPGYLYATKLGGGSQGQAFLVHSVDDGRLYVRKVATLNDVDTYAAGPFPVARGIRGGPGPVPREVSQYRPCPNVPGLVDFMTLTHNPPFTKNRNVKQFVTYWQFCNGGDLESYVDLHAEEVQRIPEIVIWRFLWQIFKAFEFLQKCLPSVSHNDISQGNIFIHWPEVSKPKDEPSTGSNANTGGAARPAFYDPNELDLYDTIADQGSGDLPDFYLGDFGYAKSTYATPAEHLGSYVRELNTLSGICAVLVFCGGKDLDDDEFDDDGEMEYNSAMAVAMSENLQFYSADLAEIYGEMNSLVAQVKEMLVLDTTPLERFIRILGSRYPKTYTNPTVKFTHPVSRSAPDFFDSKDLLLARHATMGGGTWYIATINSKDEIRIMEDAYGLPGQSTPPRTLRVINPDNGSPLTGPVPSFP